MIKKFVNFYNILQLKLFLIPVLNIDRKKFLHRQMGTDSPDCDATIIRRRSRRLITLCCITTAFITFLCTLPTNLWISLPLIIFDFAQFQFFVFIIQQQLLYLHGYTDLRINTRIDTYNGLFLLWLQNEVMLSNGDALKMKLKSGVGFVARKALTILIAKSPLRIVIMGGMRQLLKWCGVVATHQFLTLSVDLLVCTYCCISVIMAILPHVQKTP